MMQSVAREPELWDLRHPVLPCDATPTKHEAGARSWTHWTQFDAASQGLKGSLKTPNPPRNPVSHSARGSWDGEANGLRARNLALSIA